ncbi:hypothetical protein HDU97_005156 [Phlyctochytrium planicorne]|nr:hypothetical protein HDU97_005156 [Phlyctochytrium planicorne]
MSSTPTSTSSAPPAATTTAVSNAIYTQEQLNIVAIKTAAITLYLVDIFVFFRIFKSKTSLVSRLTFLFIVLQLLGVVLQFISDVGGPKNARVIIWGGVGCFMLSSELFVWTLFCRFQIVAPFKRLLQNVVRGWIILESTCIAANYIYWGYGVESNQFPVRVTAAKIYSGLSIVQSVTAAGLSGYFVITYYWPRVRSARGTKLWYKLWSSGFFYLIVEVLLHCCYTISFQVSSVYYSAVTTLATALRYALFLLFIYQIRNAAKQITTLGASETGSSSGNKSSRHLSAHDHHSQDQIKLSKRIPANNNNAAEKSVTVPLERNPSAPGFTSPSYVHQLSVGSQNPLSSSFSGSTVSFATSGASGSNGNGIRPPPNAVWQNSNQVAAARGGYPNEEPHGLYRNNSVRILPPERDERYYDNL